MAEQDSSRADIQIPESGDNSQPAQQTASRGPRVVCGVCGRKYARITRRHLRTHGLTPAQYGRVFSNEPPTNGLETPSSPQNTSSGVPHSTIQKLSDCLAESPEFLNKLATDVGAHLLGGRTRGLLAASLGALIHTRLKQAGQAAAELERVNTELRAPWRLDQGGEMGAPTPTRDVLALHEAAQQELDKASDAILRAAKLAIDERKGQAGEAPGDAPLDRYTGARDALALPDDVGPGERAIMLALFERMAGRVMQNGRVIDAETVDPPAKSQTPHRARESEAPDAESGSGSAGDA